MLLPSHSQRNFQQEATQERLAEKTAVLFRPRGERSEIERDTLMLAEV